MIIIIIEGKTYSGKGISSRHDYDGSFKKSVIKKRQKRQMGVTRDEF